MMISEDEARRAFSGRYRLLEFVGEGSDARVYVAEDLTLRRRVALKILRADTVDDTEFLERFADEMRATSDLRHPRVLPVYDWGIDPQPHTVTEYLAGGSLAAVLRAERLLTPSQALMVGLEAARALVNIHRGGRAHLGLVPSSILFDSSARPYISDLGLAAALAAAAQQPTELADTDSPDTEAAAASDSPEDSNEQHSAPASYSPSEQSQDIYDLALVLCESVTGARDLTVDLGSSDPVPVTALGPLQAVLERATAADPAERLTASELASELLRVAPLLPRPDPLPLAISKVPPADADAGPATRTEAFEPVGPTVSKRSAIPHDDAPRRRWPGLVLAVVLVLGGAGAGVWAWASSGSDSTVPELQGQTRGAIAAAAADSGWEVNEILVRAPNTERGAVVGIEPAAGVKLSEGDTLDVFVSLGEPLIVVSNLDRGLYGMTVDDATDELEDVGLDVAGETLANDDVVPAGNVMGLDVADGVHELKVGSDVVLLVSEGPADRTVPAVPQSREPGAAVDALDALGLAPRLVMEFSPDVPDGTVIGFRPASGSTVPTESTVEVRVSRGPEPPPPEEPPVIGEGVRLDGEDGGQDSEPEVQSSVG